MTFKNIIARMFLEGFRFSHFRKFRTIMFNFKLILFMAWGTTVRLIVKFTKPFFSLQNIYLELNLAYPQNNASERKLCFARKGPTAKHNKTVRDKTPESRQSRLEHNALRAATSRKSSQKDQLVIIVKSSNCNNFNVFKKYTKNQINPQYGFL